MTSKIKLTEMKTFQYFIWLKNVTFNVTNTNIKTYKCFKVLFFKGMKHFPLQNEQSIVQSTLLLRALMKALLLF